MSVNGYFEKFTPEMSREGRERKLDRDLQVIKMRYGLRWSYRKIAAKTGLSKTQVHTICSNALVLRLLNITKTSVYARGEGRLKNENVC